MMTVNFNKTKKSKKLDKKTTKDKYINISQKLMLVILGKDDLPQALAFFMLI